MRITAPTEIAPGETRVALVPRSATQLVSTGATVAIQAGAGAAAGITDAAYVEVGAEVVADRAALIADADIVVVVCRPDVAFVGQMKRGSVLVGVLEPAGDPAVVLFRGQPKDVHAWYEKTSALKVSIECGNAQPEMDDIAKCINSVFLAPTEVNETELAHANTRLAEQKNNPKKVSPRENPTGSATPMRVGNGVSPPRALRAPDPNYSQVAKSAGYQAKTVLWLIVDANGLPQNIKVERPVGLGLDDEAVKAVENWKFAPAMKDGSPVPVMINVEVNFRLY